jgi:hypothetical protein
MDKDALNQILQFTQDLVNELQQSIETLEHYQNDPRHIIPEAIDDVSDLSDLLPSIAERINELQFLIDETLP